MTIFAQGADYAFPPIPTIAALQGAGVEFVCRYGGKGTTDKMLTANETNRLRAAGIDIVANVEGSEGGFSGYAAGQNYARAGLDWFNPLGLPNDRPIYFSVDVGDPDWAGVRAACQGAASVIGLDRVGIYGGYRTIAYVHDAGLAKWFWQTYAWSNGQWHPAAHIEQYRNGVKIGGADCDLDRAMQADYGQWGYQMSINWTDTYGDYGHGGRTFAQRTADDGALRDWLWGDATGSQAAPNFGPNAPLSVMLAGAKAVPGVAASVAALSAKLDALTTAVTGIPEEVLQELGKEDLTVAAQALRTVLGDTKAAELGALLSSPAA